MTEIHWLLALTFMVSPPRINWIRFGHLIWFWLNFNSVKWTNLVLSAMNIIPNIVIVHLTWLLLFSNEKVHQGNIHRLRLLAAFNVGDIPLMTCNPADLNKEILSFLPNILPWILESKLSTQFYRVEHHS